MNGGRFDFNLRQRRFDFTPHPRRFDFNLRVLFLSR
jgi:hypothetical protein